MNGWLLARVNFKSLRADILRLVLYTQIPDDENLGRQWNELVQQMECPEIFYTYEWASAVSWAYRATLTPLLFLAYEQDSLVGIAALAIDNGRQKTFFLAGATADYCDFVSHPERRLEFVKLVLAELQGLRTLMLVLANLPADSATPRALRLAADLNGCLIFSRPAYSCAQIALGSSLERQSVKLSVGKRKALRYCLKGLGKHGPVHADHLTSWDSIQTALPQFIQAHITRFGAVGRTSSLVHPERQDFLTALAELLCATGGMVLSRLRAGERPVAWSYGFRFRGSWSYYQPTFDGGLQQFSPGFCLLSKILESACDRPEIERVDLGLGAETYKQRFATAVRQTLHVTVTTSTLRYLKESARYHAASVIKSSPRIENYARCLLGHSPAGGHG